MQISFIQLTENILHFNTENITRSLTFNGTKEVSTIRICFLLDQDIPAIIINSHFIRINIRNGKEILIMTEIIYNRKMKSNIINFLFITFILNIYLTQIILSSKMQIKIENKVKRILNKSHKNLDSIRRKFNMIISSKISPHPLIFMVIKCLY